MALGRYAAETAFASFVERRVPSGVSRRDIALDISGNGARRSDCEQTKSE